MPVESPYRAPGLTKKGADAVRGRLLLSATNSRRFPLLDVDDDEIQEEAEQAVDKLG